MKEVKTRKKDKQKQNYYYDYSLLVVVILLMTFGLIMLYSISSYTAMVEGNSDMHYFKRQLFFSVTGLVIMYVFSKISYLKLGKASLFIYLGSIILMSLVYTPLGVSVNGATRWIEIAGIQFQPSEVAKLAAILFLPYRICRSKLSLDKWGNWITSRLWVKVLPVKFRKRQALLIKEWKDNAVSITLYGAVLSLIIWRGTDNLSTAIIVAGITLGIVAISSKIGLLIAGIVGAVVAGVLGLIFTIGPDFLTPIIKEFRTERIRIWLDPSLDPLDSGYQILQGLYAIGSGGWFGKGLGNGTQKLSAIPEVQNDYIIAAIIEELGIFGAAMIMLLFILLLYRLFFIATNAPDMFGGLVASGIFIHIALQVIFNIGVVTTLLPNTGITLPFISYGGTATWMLLAEIGIALQISSKIKMPDDTEIQKSSIKK